MIVLAAAVACAMPNVPARVVHAEAPQTPAIAWHNGISGTVQVVISLDAASRITNTRIQSSPSAVLNQAALSAARQSTYQTEIVGCVPIAAEYIFSVDFIKPDRVTTTASGAPAVEVSAIGTASRVSDVAYVYAIVPAEVDANASTTVATLLTALRTAGVSDADVDIAAHGGPTARRLVTVRVTNIADAQKVATVVGSIPAVALQGMGLGLRDRGPAFDDAVSAAVKDALPRARALAAANGRGLGAQAGLERGRADIISSTYVTLRTAPGGEPPTIPALRPGPISVRAFATVTYLLVP